MPAYDYGKMMQKIFSNSSVATERAEIFRDAMWVNVPLLTESYRDWDFGGNYSGSQVLPCDVKVRLRVAKPYRRMLTGIIPAGTNQPISNDSMFVAQNNNVPMYTFNTHDLKVTLNDQESAKNALELINVVPNPYYAYSDYETNQLDNRVKFTCLPEKCTIRIYTVNGTLIRKLTKDAPQTYLDWDLKNQAGIPIASGMYIIHVETTLPDGTKGEKILKWFGVLRPIDLDAY
jgi:hypothetical protein